MAKGPRMPAKDRLIQENKEPRHDKGLPPLRAAGLCVYSSGHLPCQARLQDPDEFCLPRLGIPEKQLPTLLFLRVNELVQADRAVSNVCLRQLCPVLKALEVLRCLWYQSDSDPVSGLRTGSISPGRGAAVRASSHLVQFSLRGTPLQYFLPPGFLTISSNERCGAMLLLLCWELFMLRVIAAPVRFSVLQLYLDSRI